MTDIADALGPAGVVGAAAVTTYGVIKTAQIQARRGKAEKRKAEPEADVTAIDPNLLSFVRQMAESMVEEMRESVRRLDDQNHRLEARISEQNNQIDRLRERVEERNQRITQLEHEVRRLRSRRTSNEAEELWPRDGEDVV